MNRNITTYADFCHIIKDLIHNDTVLQMKNYKQHYDTTTYKHCFNVSFLNYKICKKLKLDYKSAARAGMLHDLFLYNWRGSSEKLDGLHAFEHPKIALKNAEKITSINKLEKDIILTHMWPVTLFHFPKYKESFIITLTDKYSALYESFSYYFRFLHKKKVYKYAYIFLGLLFLL